jgi:hypothetical protein
MSRGNAWLLVIAALGLLCVGAFFSAFERKEVDVDLPPSGKAAINHFYALERAMRGMGLPAHSVTGIPTGDESLVVFGVNPSNLDRDDMYDLLSLADDGARVVLRTGSEAEMARAFFWKDLSKEAGLASAGTGCLQLQGHAGEKPYEWCGTRVKLRAAARIDGLGDAKGDLMVTFHYGEGTITLVPSLAPFMGRGIENPVARRLLVRVLHLDDNEQSAALVYRVEGDRIWSLLFTRGWPAMLAFAVLLAAWAMSRAVRFGPLLDTPRADRRALVEHVQAAGEFLYRRDRGRGLHVRVCAGVLARARRLDPGTDGLEGESLHARLAERFEEAPADVAQAFRPPADVDAFRDSIAILSRLRRHP